MATGHDFTKGTKAAKVEYRELGHEDGNAQHRVADQRQSTSKHVRVDSKVSNGLSRHKSTKKPEPRFPPLPVGASPRILCLDGGGIRGIVQLEVLRGIELALGDHIPAAAFFDLIVGTGTGGLIAMTLSKRGQTVNTCIDHFRTICDRAFRPKIKAAAPLVRSISAALGSGRRYRSKSLYDVLQTTFGENSSLLESPVYFTQGSRVAVASTNAADQDPFLLTNYPRPETLEQHEQNANFLVWQSVAATIADPAYFPPFEHDAQTYLDGGIKCGNPAAIADKERRQIWPEADKPDLFLSLGTGQHKLENLEEISKQTNRSSADKEPMSPPTKRPARMSRRWSGRPDGETVDGERAWADFKANAVNHGLRSKARNFVRLNPDLGKAPPAPDSKHEIEPLHDTVRKLLQGSPRATGLRNIAHRLVASSFYLDSRSTVTDELGERIFSGAIACRFKYGSTQLRALGRILRDRTTKNFEPYFLIKPDASSKYQSSTVKFTKEILTVMIERGIFALPSVSIPLHDESKETTLNLFLEPADAQEPDGFPISGFPDVLDNQLTRQQSKQKAVPEPRSRQRALSEQTPDTNGRIPKSGFLSRTKSTSIAPPSRFLSRAKSTSIVPARFSLSSKLQAQAQNRTSLPPPVSQRDPSLHLHRVSTAETITEEPQLHPESGAFIDRRSRSSYTAPQQQQRNQFYNHTNANMTQQQQRPELFSPEEIAQFAGGRHARTTSVATDFDSPFDDRYSYGHSDDLWSPLDGTLKPLNSP